MGGYRGGIIYIPLPSHPLFFFSIKNMVSKRELQTLLDSAKRGIVKTDIIIAIDPDIERSGVAELNKSTKQIKLFSLSFPDLMDYLISTKRICEIKNLMPEVIVEAGWLNKGNWHLSDADSKYSAAEKGRQTGRNHETGRKIVEMCKHYQFITEEVRPLRKFWKGKDKKITSEEFNRLTGYSGRSSQDMRDAGVIAWVYAGLIVKM